MINYDLQKIRTIIFDIDGVLSAETISLGDDGQPRRTVNIKDGYAIQLAQKMGLRIAIITGCKIEAVATRYRGLGVEDIFLGDEVMYMGDDIPDLEIMRRVGCPVCPKDACTEVKSVSIYISNYAGGYGCGRDVIEQTMKAQGHWLKDERAFGW